MTVDLCIMVQAELLNKKVLLERDVPWKRNATLKSIGPLFRIMRQLHCLVQQATCSRSRAILTGQSTTLSALAPALAVLMLTFASISLQLAAHEKNTKKVLTCVGYVWLKSCVLVVSSTSLVIHSGCRKVANMHGFQQCSGLSRKNFSVAAALVPQ